MAAWNVLVKDFGPLDKNAYEGRLREWNPRDCADTSRASPGRRLLRSQVEHW